MSRSVRALRILHVLPAVDDRFGGPGSLLATIVGLDGRANLRSIVVSGVGKEGEVAAHIRSSVPLFVYPNGLVLGRLHASFRLLISVWRRIGDTDVVVAHSMFNLPTVFAGLAARLRKRPLIVAPHGSLDPYDVQKHRRLKLMLSPLWRLLLNRAELWCVTDLEAREVITFGARPRRHVVSPPIVVPPSMSRDRALATLGPRLQVAGPRGSTVSFIGRFDVKKGIPRLLEAFDEAAGDDDVLVLAGAGEPYYEATVTSHILASRRLAQVRLPGWLTAEDKQALLTVSDIFALASDDENFGMAVVEAMAAGVPVVLTDRVAVAGLVKASDAGQVTPADAHAFAGALTSYLHDRTRRLADGTRARQAVVSTFSPQAVAERYRAMLEEVAEPRIRSTG